MKIIKERVTLDELKELAHEQFLNVIKAVVDIEQKIMAVGGELHVDMEVLLMEEEHSKRNDTWGINLYLDKTGDDFIEFDSMINLKPSLGNNTRNVENSDIQEKIKVLVHKIVS